MAVLQLWKWKEPKHYGQTGRHLLNLKALTKVKLDEGKTVGGRGSLPEDKNSVVQWSCYSAEYTTET